MLIEYMVLFVQLAFLMSDLWRLTCHFSSATCRLSETEFGFAFAIGAVAALIQRLCLFRVCDNIVDATNLNDYVRTSRTIIAFRCKTVCYDRLKCGKHCSFVCRRTVATPNRLNANMA